MSIELLSDIVKPFTDITGIDISNKATQLFEIDVSDIALDYYVQRLIPHKIAVYGAGVSLLHTVEDKSKFIKNLVCHDLSRFSIKEASGYALRDVKKDRYILAMHHHFMHNPHHPEYWLNPHRSGIVRPIAMPHLYVVEMIADWIGAAQIYGNNVKHWIPDNIDKYIFANKDRVYKTIQSCLKHF